MRSIINKIFTEPPVLKDKYFHVVQDKEPVCPEHYLIFPREECKSLADMSTRGKIYLNDLICSTFSKEFAFFERGNVSFCTSANGPTYAHGHIINTKYFNKNLLDSMLEPHSAVETFSILNGLTLVSTNDEYLLGGEINSRWRVALPFANSTKRYVRKILMENLIYEAIH